MQKFKIEIKWAVIFTLAAIAWMGLERAFGLHDSNIAMHANVSFGFGIIAIVLYVFALLDKRKNYYHGIMSWKEGFLSGCIISILVAILTPVSIYVSTQLISPDFFENMITYTVDQGLKTREEADAYFTLSNYIIESSVFGFVAGVITSAIVALFIRRKPRAASV